MVSKVLNVLGFDEGDEPTPEDIARQRRFEQYSNGWSWLRNMLDRQIEAYLTTGDKGRLNEIVASPARERLFAHLDALRAQGLSWSLPERSRTSPTIEVIHEEGTRDRSTIFVVRESFDDTSVLTGPSGTSLGEGVRRMIEARVHCTGKTEFVLMDVRRVDADA